MSFLMATNEHENWNTGKNGRFHLYSWPLDHRILCKPPTVENLGPTSLAITSKDAANGVFLIWNLIYTERENIRFQSFKTSNLNTMSINAQTFTKIFLKQFYMVTYYVIYT